jgi:multidrug efflux pump subunit AcrA (membrane-fusion protein)
MDVVVAKKKRRWGSYLGVAGVLVALAGVTGGVHRLGQAAPLVPRSSVWIDRVQRGQFLREVNAPGTLVSDEVRLLTARATGIVDRVHLKPGATVEPDTLLLELSNPDLEFAALEAATAVKEARAELLDLQASVGIRRIEQRTALENAKVEYREALRRSKVSEALVGQNAVSKLDAEQQRERKDELEQLIRFHEEHTHVLESGAAAQATAQRARVEGLRAQADLRAAQFAGLKVRAGAAGVLAELEVEVGQQVTIGGLLGKVIDPQKLKAELRVPEAQAEDVAVGQLVRVAIQNDEALGRVTRIDPGVRQGAVRVEVSFDRPLPAGARLDLSVDARIEIERVQGALFTGKPASAGANETVGLFKLAADGQSAERVSVKLGRSSVHSVEVLSGLREGDRVILSDMSEWDHDNRIQLE